MKSELLQNIFLVFVVDFFIKLHGQRKENQSGIESVVVKPVKHLLFVCMHVFDIQMFMRT